MRKIETWLVRVFRVAIGIAFAVLITVVLIQVIGRYLGASPIWTEELTRYALLYLVAIGVGLSFQSGDLVNVDVFCEAIPKKWSSKLRMISDALTVFMCAVLLVPAWRYVEIGQLQTSPAMGLQMTYVHFTAFALLAILLIFSLLRVVAMLFPGDNGQSSDERTNQTKDMS